MTLNRKYVFPLVVVVAIATLFFISRRFAPKPAAKGTSPEFSVTDLQGQKLALADYRGKVVLLDFWATWCAPCLEEIPHFVEMQQKYGPQGMQVIGISMDDNAKPVQAFYQQQKMNYPVAIGDAKLAERYGGVLGLPVTFVIDREGRIAKKFVGATDTKVIEQEVVRVMGNS